MLFMTIICGLYISELLHCDHRPSLSFSISLPSLSSLKLSLSHLLKRAHCASSPILLHRPSFSPLLSSQDKSPHSCELLHLSCRQSNFDDVPHCRLWCCLACSLSVLSLAQSLVTVWVSFSCSTSQVLRFKNPRA